MTEAMGNKLLKFRSPLTSIKLDGDWSPGSKLWDPKLKQIIGDEHFSSQNSDENTDNEMTFWMSYQEAVNYFKSMNVCRVRNWNEIRLKGKFLRIQDAEQA